MDAAAYLRSLHDAARSVGRQADQAGVVEAAVHEVSRALGPAAVLLSEGEGYRVCGASGSASVLCDLPKAAIDPHCIVHAQRALAISDLGADLPVDVCEAWRRYAFGPIDAGGEVLGLLAIARPPAELSSLDLELLCGIGSVVAVALEQIRLRDRAVLDERRMRRLSGYFSPRVAERLADACHHEGSRVEASVLFSDIRGFTHWSAHREPAEILAFLNRYFDRMTALVVEHGGIVDKLIGDGLMAVFGTPFELEDHARSAAACAVAMAGAAREFDGPDGQLRIGVGVHTGPVITGDLGGETFRDYTVLGPTVNLASRLESAAGQLGVTVVLSEACRSRAGLPTRPHGPIAVKGLDEPVTVHEVLLAL